MRGSVALLAAQQRQTFPSLVVLSEITRRQRGVLFLDLLFMEDRCRSLNCNHPNTYSRGNRARRGQTQRLRPGDQHAVGECGSFCKYDTQFGSEAEGLINCDGEREVTVGHFHYQSLFLSVFLSLPVHSESITLKETGA